MSQASTAQAPQTVAGLQVFTDEQLAHQLGISVRTLIENWESTGVAPPHFRVNNVRLYLVSDVRDWILQNRRFVPTPLAQRCGAL